MTLGPGAPTPAIDPIVIRLYDEIKEMRTEVGAMRTDMRDLAADIRLAVSQGGDHEARIRVLERSAITTEVLEAQNKERDKDFEARMRAGEHHAWKTAGIAAAVGLLVESGVALLIVKAVTGH
jgi:hypothetical protein